MILTSLYESLSTSGPNRRATKAYSGRSTSYTSNGSARKPVLQSCAARLCLQQPSLAPDPNGVFVHDRYQPTGRRHSHVITTVTRLPGCSHHADCPAHSRNPGWSASLGSPTLAPRFSLAFKSAPREYRKLLPYFYVHQGENRLLIEFNLELSKRRIARSLVPSRVVFAVLCNPGLTPRCCPFPPTHEPFFPRSC
jgi:hypothetical protein